MFASRASSNLGFGGIARDSSQGYAFNDIHKRNTTNTLISDDDNEFDLGGMLFGNHNNKNKKVA